MKANHVFVNRKHKKVIKIGTLKNAHSLTEEADSFEQMACRTLMKESETFYETTKEEDEPDAFLRISPKLDEPIANVDKKSGFKSGNFLSNKTAKPGRLTIPISFPIKKTYSLENEYLWEMNSSSSQRTMSVNKIENDGNYLIGKEVLCLTEYIASGPQISKNSLEFFKKPEQSNYLRVLKRMKNRNTKNIAKFQTTATNWSSNNEVLPIKKNSLFLSTQAFKGLKYVSKGDKDQNERVPRRQSFRITEKREFFREYSQ